MQLVCTFFHHVLYIFVCICSHKFCSLCSSSKLQDFEAVGRHVAVPPVHLRAGQSAECDAVVLSRVPSGPNPQGIPSVWVLSWKHTLQEGSPRVWVCVSYISIVMLSLYFIFSFLFQHEYLITKLLTYFSLIFLNILLHETTSCQIKNLSVI